MLCYLSASICQRCELVATVLQTYVYHVVNSYKNNVFVPSMHRVFRTKREYRWERFDVSTMTMADYDFVLKLYRYKSDPLPNSSDYTVIYLLQYAKMVSRWDLKVRARDTMVVFRLELTTPVLPTVFSTAQETEVPTGCCFHESNYPRLFFILLNPGRSNVHLSVKLYVVRAWL